MRSFYRNPFYFIFFLSLFRIDVHNIFRVGVIALACIVLLLLAVIGVLIWRLRRALPNNRTTAVDKVITDYAPRDQHQSYIELRPRTPEEQLQYQALQDENVTPGYDDVVTEKESCKSQYEDVYTEIGNVQS